MHGQGPPKPSVDDRLSFAQASFEVGLAIRAPEKKKAGKGSISSAVRSLRSALMRIFCEIRALSGNSGQDARIFSAVQTGWRRERDSTRGFLVIHCK